MSRILNYQLVIEKLLLSRFNIFTTLEFQRLFGASKIGTQKFLAKYARKGAFTKLKNGLYVFNLNPPSEMIIANKLYQPSYISFEYALSFYGLIPESVYTITSATAKSTRSFNVQGKLFQYYRIKQSVYQGYLPRKINDKTVFLAEPEKALADYLYFISLKKKVVSDRLNLKKIKKDKLFFWLNKFQSLALIKLTKSLYRYSAYSKIEPKVS